MKYLFSTVFFILGILGFQQSIANGTPWSSVKTIHSFSKAVAMIKANTSIPVLFPTVFPKKSGQSYFANFELEKSGDSYYLYVDSTADCSGAHYCNIGMIYAQKNGKPEINYNIDKKKITVPVQLRQGTVGYYTPGYAMADYHPPQLQWLYKNVLYTLVWDTESKVLVEMANSAMN